MATVLIVDDEFGIAELFEAILSEAGHRVLCAINGQHGLEILGNERVDLVFLDYMMPIMNGAMMLQAMAANPSLHDIPVAVMSSLTESAVAQRCSGYAAFLRKPFRIGQVLALTDKLLAGGSG